MSARLPDKPVMAWTRAEMYLAAQGYLRQPGRHG